MTGKEVNSQEQKSALSRSGGSPRDELHSGYFLIRSKQEYPREVMGFSLFSWKVINCDCIGLSDPPFKAGKNKQGVVFANIASECNVVLVGYLCRAS